MLDLITIFPPYLIGFTVLFILIPTIVTLGVRIQLHHYLMDTNNKVRRLIKGVSPGEIPSLVTKLEARFEEAGSQLESINTSALIEGVYSQEKFSWFGKSFSCQQWEYFTNILPNLLLALGLLGTFWGITLNLTNISSILQEGGQSNEIFQNLQTPLRSMGIAFFTSLIALGCSSVLTFINLRFNTNLSTNWLIASLEDYLDNIFHPRVDGFTRLDKAINRMVDRQEDFLTRFHEKVGQVLESSLTPVANRIADENEKANRLATQVYQRFMEATGTLSSSAVMFRDTVISLESQVNKIDDCQDAIKKSCLTMQAGAKVFAEAADRIENSKFSDRLEETTHKLVEVHTNFANSTSLLTNNLEQIITSNKQANEIATQVYAQLQQSTGTLEKSATGFLQASLKIENSQFPDKLSSATVDLVRSQEQFNRSTSVLSESVLSISSFIQDFQTSVREMVNLGNGISQLNSSSIELLELNKEHLLAENNKFTQIKDAMSKLIDIWQRDRQQNQTELKNWQERSLSNISEYLARSCMQLQSLSETIEQCRNYLHATNNILQSHTGNLSDVIVRENAFNKEYFKYISQSVQQSLLSLNKLVEISGNRD